ncbi:hypothetical protein ARNL5_03559 [Anaerolineae bacterium]|nr:hypothetical protein ARNL5_03559 [Anaerolineae bacterium]
MNVLNNTINRMEQLIREVPERIRKINKSEFESKPQPEKWSKKEILGHLCDSAVNNLSRFIRAQFEPRPFAILRYAQDDWVRCNKYQEKETEDLLALWVTLNHHIAYVVSKIPEERLSVVCDLGDAAFRDGDVEKNLLWLIEDYVVHMEYHLKQIIGKL